MAQAVIYARVSSREQEQEGYSIDAQLELMRSYAGQQGLQVIKEFSVAESAKQAGRKEFGRLCEFLRENPGTILLVEKVDRLTRNLYDAVDIKRLGVNCHFVKEGFVLDDNSTSNDHLIWGVKVLLAEHFVNNHREEVNKGMDQKARSGHFPGKAPLGYLNARDGARRVIVVDPDRKLLVHRLFESVALDCLSVESAAGLASEIGLFTKTGKILTASGVHRMLRNEFYIGYFRWKGELCEGAHEPIIERSLFERVQAVLDGKSPKRRRTKLPSFVFRGLLTCGSCGRTLSPEKKSGRHGRGHYVYYTCKNVKCHCKSGLREETLIEAAGKLLDQIKLPEEILEVTVRALKESFEAEEAQYAESLAGLEAQATRLRARLKSMYVDKLDGRIETGTYDNLREEWSKELRQVENELSRLDGSRAKYFDAGVRFLAIAQDAGRIFREADAGDKREILSSVMDGMVVRDGELETLWKVPFGSMRALSNLEPKDISPVSNKREWWS